MTLDIEELILLLQDTESDRVEYKESLSGDAPTKIREAICAFANDLPDHRKSGVVFVGARNDGSVVGLPVTDRLLQQLGDMKTDGNILPPPSITVEKRSIQGKDVAVVTVQPSDSPPVRCKGTIQIRIGPRRGIATAQDERILNEKRLYKDIPFDIQPIPSASLDDLNSVYFEHEYLSRAFAREIVEANERSREEQLAATKMIASADDPKPTILGILVLGKWTQDYLPGAYVQFLRFMGRELADPISDEEAIGGSIADVLRRLDEKLNGHNRTAVDFISGPVERRASTYPIEAIRQITRNAIMHRTYESTNAPVHVHWFEDRIEITSPGGPFGRVTADNFGHAGAVDYRNPNVADAMKTLGFVQRFGLGIPIAQSLLAQAGHPEIEFTVDQSGISATIRTASRKEGPR